MEAQAAVAGEKANEADEGGVKKGAIPWGSGRRSWAIVETIDERVDVGAAILASPGVLEGKEPRLLGGGRGSFGSICSSSREGSQGADPEAAHPVAVFCLEAHAIGLVLCDSDAIEGLIESGSLDGAGRIREA